MRINFFIILSTAFMYHHANYSLPVLGDITNLELNDKFTEAQKKSRISKLRDQSTQTSPKRFFEDPRKTPKKRKIQDSVRADLINEDLSLHNDNEIGVIDNPQTRVNPLSGHQEKEPNNQQREVTSTDTTSHAVIGISVISTYLLRPRSIRNNTHIPVNRGNYLSDNESNNQKIRTNQPPNLQESTQGRKRKKIEYVCTQYGC